VGELWEKRNNIRCHVPRLGRQEESLQPLIKWKNLQEAGRQPIKASKKTLASSLRYLKK